MGSLVTVGTDGFRDFVEIPDGRTFNLGSVSVLTLVSSLVSSSVLARKALDTFLAKGMATISVDLNELEDLLRPKRSRWAVHENRLISPGLRPSPFRGASTMTTKATAFLKQVSDIETHLSVMARQSSPAHVTTLRNMVAALANAEQIGFERRLASVEALLGTFQPGTVNPGKVNALQKLTRDLLAGDESKESEEKESRFEEGKPADPTENMSPEDAKRWKEEHDKNKDNFKASTSTERIANEGPTTMPAEVQKAEDAPKNPYAGKDQSDNSMPYKLAGEGEVSGDAAQVAKDMKAPNPYAGKDQSKNDTFYKLAMVNEALATTLLTKVDAALQVVQASDRTNAEVAKMDLHTISSKLATMLQEMQLTDENLQAGLLDLSGKVAKIHGHFAAKPADKG